MESRSRRQRLRVERSAFAALDDLEAQFSIFRPESELSRWRRREVDRPSDELSLLLGAGVRWQQESAGVLNPAVGVLSRQWANSAETGTVPDEGDLAGLVASIVEPRYHNGVCVGDCSELTFHALAKGLIVDLAAHRAIEGTTGVGIVVNVGGDLRSLGDGAVIVGIENPLRTYDNEPPLLRVQLVNGALATSGGSRRGWRIGERWFSHVIDPRTGWPVDHIASASVIAADAMTADAVATVLSVLPIAAGLAFADRKELAACIVAADGTIALNERWRAISAP